MTHGPQNPQEILHILGREAVQRYLVDEVQKVYHSQGVNVHDKHIEVIVRQMLRWVKIKEVGDTEFLLEEQVDRFRFQDENERVRQEDGEVAQAEPLLLGITKASLSTDSFISAASFQETTRVLTEAAISGRVDYLRGLKENVIMATLCNDLQRQSFGQAALLYDLQAALPWCFDQGFHDSITSAPYRKPGRRTSAPGY